MAFYFKFKQCVPEACKYYTAKYGGQTVCLRVWPYGRIWITCRPEFASAVFSSRKFVHRIGHPSGLKQLSMLHQGIIWNNDSVTWGKLRKLFNKAVLQDASLEQAVQLSRAAFECTLAEEMAASPAAESLHIDVLDFFRLCTFRVTAALTLGIPVDHLPRMEAMAIVRTVGAYFKAWDYLLLLPPVVQKLRILTGWDKGCAKGHNQAIESYRRVADELIATATQLLVGQSDGIPAFQGSPVPTSQGTPVATPRAKFLKDLLHLKEQGELSHEGVTQMVMEMLLAGTDTSSVTMTWVALSWQEQPDLELAVLREVQQLQRDPGLWTVKEDIAQLRLLGDCTDESMRRKPVGPVIIRKATEDDCITVIDPKTHQEVAYELRKGDGIIVDLASMGMLRENFPQPQSFDPVRNFADNALMGGDNAAAARTRPAGPAAGMARFMPFGNGPKMCVGYRLADVEMKVLLALWVTTFETGGGVACGPTLEATDTKWEIANHPTHEVVLNVKLRKACMDRRLDSGGSNAGGGSDGVLGGSFLSTPCSGSSPEGEDSTLLDGGSHSSTSIGNFVGVSAAALSTAAAAAMVVEGEAAAGAAETVTCLRRVYLCGPHGAGKTTLWGDMQREQWGGCSWSVAAAVLPNQQVLYRPEAARQVMIQLGISTADLIADDRKYLQLQLAIINRQFAIEVGNAEGSRALGQTAVSRIPSAALAAAITPTVVVADRCALDALAYTAFRFGIDSKEVERALGLKEMQWLLEQRYLGPGAVVVLVPPFSQESSVDDGVRLVSDWQGLAKFCKAMRAVMRRAGVVFVELQATEREARVHEVLSLLLV